MKLLFRLSIPLLLGMMPTALVAQSAPSADAELRTICMPTLRRWNGTTEEIRQIQQIPIPESYRTGIGGGCGGPILADFLVSWHLRFGTEKTVQEALHYIEERDGDAVAMASKMDRSLADALNGLKKELKDAHATYDKAVVKKNSDASALKKALETEIRFLTTSGPSFTKLRSIKDELNREFLNRINLYLTAAEVFRSDILVAKADRLFALHQAMQLRMLPVRLGGQTDKDEDFQNTLEYVEESSTYFLTPMEIDLRIAILQAQLAPSEKTFANARKAIERRYEPALANAPKVAFGGGDDFCDLYEDNFLNDWEREIAYACKYDDAFERKAFAYGYADAMFAILNDLSVPRRFGQWSWDDYVVLYRKSAIYGNSFGGYVSSPEDRVLNLTLALVDQKAGHDSNEGAWDLLAELWSMVNPSQNPVRFRQIAERAILIGEELQKKDGGWDRRTAQIMAYYRLNLANLDRLATGQMP